MWFVNSEKYFVLWEVVFGRHFFLLQFGADCSIIIFVSFELFTGQIRKIEAIKRARG